MRIIAGKYRGRKLKSPPSLRTRPTSDRLRETLFNILAPRIEGARFLDLCAGTGAVGIEAISRGAAHVTFVEQSRKMCSLIDANVEALKIGDERIELFTADALEFLRRRLKKTTQPFDLVFFDPPYTGDYESVLDYLGRQRELLADEVVVVVEHHKRRDLAEAFGQLRRYRVVKQGDSTLSFFSV
ncbi:MAG TPA: 16S rRNA (guanine(966)-N(2))-methyltransferase RsmD [Pyrinomonadaceae bacterium]|nr:16S rRNA (guanine(966)-N(2))-methyltransferase RsmD [Pyrinomonadaceae bacterium]